MPLGLARSFFAAQALPPSASPTPVLLLLLLLGACGLMIFVVLIFRRKAGETKRTAEPTCGKCGYIVKGLSTFTCPECGSDLREVGIISAAAPARSSGMNPFLRWTLWAAPICLAMFGLTFVEHKDEGPGLPRSVYLPPLLILSLLNWLVGLLGIALLSHGRARFAPWSVSCWATVIVLGILNEMTHGQSGPGIPPQDLLVPLMCLTPLVWVIGLPVIYWRSRRSGPTPPTAIPGAPPAAPVAKTLTVMLTDMKDYTARVADLPRDRMMSLIQHHRGLVQPTVRRRAGRIMKSTGDGLIVVFDSATDALLAAIEIQAASQTDPQPSFAEDHKLPLRIAVSTGEVTLADGDVFGHPVNLASRVQQLAQPGEVYFTDSTYHAMNRSEIGYAEMGAVEIKGLSEKVNLYRAVAKTRAS